MSESVELIAQLTAGWRVLRIANRPGWGRPAWNLQRLTDGEWRCEAVVRASGMLREIVKAWAGRIGPIEEAAAAILDALPARADIGGPRPDPAMVRAAAVARAAERRAAKRAAVAAREEEKRAATAAAEKARVNPVPKPGTKRAAVAAAFLQWRAAQNEEARS